MGTLEDRIADIADRVSFIRDAMAAGPEYFCEDGLVGLNSILNGLESDLRSIEKELSKGDYRKVA